MTGIRILVQQGAECTFGDLFEPLLPSMETHWWRCHMHLSGVLLNIIDDPEKEALVSSFSEASDIPPGVFLPRFAHDLVDDWLYLYALSTPLGDAPLEWKDFLSHSTVQMAFLNIDGGSWYFYARDAAALEEVNEHAQSIRRSGKVSDVREIEYADWLRGFR